MLDASNCLQRPYKGVPLVYGSCTHAPILASSLHHLMQDAASSMPTPTNPLPASHHRLVESYQICYVPFGRHVNHSSLQYIQYPVSKSATPDLLLFRPLIDLTRILPIHPAVVTMSNWNREYVYLPCRPHPVTVSLLSYFCIGGVSSHRMICIVRGLCLPF